MNTVKRYARAATPQCVQRVPKSRPENLTEGQRERLKSLIAACPEMTALATVVRSFAALLTPHENNPDLPAAWTTAAREADLPHVHSFARGIDQDIDAVTAAITLKHHNGRTGGVNTKTKLFKRQMYGRAGIDLLMGGGTRTTASAPSGGSMPRVIQDLVCGAGPEHLAVGV